LANLSVTNSPQKQPTNLSRK